jgi:hypothetical protein
MGARICILFNAFSKLSISLSRRGTIRAFSTAVVARILKSRMLDNSWPQVTNRPVCDWMICLTRISWSGLIAPANPDTAKAPTRSQATMRLTICRTRRFVDRLDRFAGDG